MYHWIEDKEFLGRMRRECSDVVNRLVQIINNGDYLEVEMQLVGSGAKKLETQNANEPIDIAKRLKSMFVKNSIKLLNLKVGEIVMIQNLHLQLKRCILKMVIKLNLVLMWPSYVKQKILGIG